MSIAQKYVKQSILLLKDWKTAMHGQDLNNVQKNKFIISSSDYARETASLMNLVNDILWNRYQFLRSFQIIDVMTATPRILFHSHSNRINKCHLP